MKQFVLILFAICCCMPNRTAAQSNDKTESPYFLIKSKGEKQAFPLNSTKAKVNISGPIADVRIVQSYTNKSNDPIEALYVFPASTRAAVYHMEMHVGSRVVKAKIKEKQEARKIHHEAKEAGKRTSLLEQHRPNVFQMNIANIMPGETIEVHMYYTEFLLPRDQEYTFVYPTVVGPRYTGEQAASWDNQPRTKSGIPAAYDFDIDVRLNTAIPIQNVLCSSHKVTSKKYTSQSQQITLHSTENNGGNRDFILRYSLAGNKIESGILTYSNEKESYFLCQMEAPQINTKPVIIPREYIFVMDVSGSMHGFPLNTSKELMQKLFATLRPTDRFNVLFFAGSAFVMHPESIDATPSNIEAAVANINFRRGGGGTNMFGAIQKAMAIPKVDEFSRSFVIVTDGYVSVEQKAFEYVNTNLGKANFFAFGIGSSVNRHLIEGLANAGRGEAFIVTNPKEAGQEAKRLKSYIEYPMLTNIKVEAKGVEIYDVVPKSIPDLMANRPIYVFGKYKNSSNPSIRVSGDKGCNRFEQVLHFDKSGAKAIEHLWAREKIRFLSDYNFFGTSDQRVKEITALGLKHSLLTEYTSFVAVDEEVVNPSRQVNTTKQILPLPQGVSNYAVGFEMEIPELLVSEKATASVNIISKNSAMVQSIEAVLEVILKEDDFKHYLLSDLNLELRFDENGILVVNNNELHQLLVNALKKALLKVGLLYKDEVVLLTIKR